MGTVTPLRRSASRTRELLLAAAGELFAERGYDRTTVREVGERAGVDPALIARYFGSKAALYIAALRAEVGDDVPADLLEPGRVAALLDRARHQGSSPVYQAAVRPHDDADVQAAAREQLQQRLVEPLRRRFSEDGAPRPGLRAELAAAAFTGVVLGAGSGAFEELAAEPVEQLVALVQEMLGALST